MMRTGVDAGRGVEGMRVGSEKGSAWQCTVTCRGDGAPALVDGGKGGLPRERHLATAAGLVSKSARAFECEPSFFVECRGWCRLAEDLQRQSSDRPNALAPRERTFRASLAPIVLDRLDVIASDRAGVVLGVERERGRREAEEGDLCGSAEVSGGWLRGLFKSTV